MPPTPDPAADLDGDSASDGLIRALPDTLASKIAAGEVVQRPANALKELVENSLDAGASRVEVTLGRAGSELIQVLDDGAGMGPRDAEMAFGRHATSKLRAFEDLERLRTLGFRGEALASIASVARVEMKTRRRQDAAALCVRVDGGRFASATPCAAPEGTCLSVRDLFYNVPARRAFLKSPATEFKHLVETFQALALSHPGVAFTLVHDGTEVYRLGAGTLVDRLADLFGATGALVPVEEATSYVSVRGLVGPPERARRGRGEQYLFVNGRFVKSRSLDHAVATAYGALLPEKAYPLSVLFLDVDPRHVDVNVHPTKTAVLFDDDRGIYSMVRAVVKKGLAEAGLALAVELPLASPVAPTVASSAPWPEPPVASPGDASPRDAFPAPAGPAPTGGEPFAMPPAPSGPAHGDGATREIVPGPPPESWAPPSVDPSRAFSGPLTPAGPAAPGARALVPSRLDLPAADEARSDVPDVRSLWLLHGRYLLSPVRSGLLIIDRQAAQERIFYERALDALDGGMAPSQQLLFPRTVALSAADRALLGEIAAEIAGLGFDLVLPKGDGPVVVRGVPADVLAGDERDLLDDLLTQFRRNADRLSLAPRDNLARSLARRSAARASLGPDDAATLVDQLFACREPFTDPAGRPTTIQLPLDEFERRFKR